MPGRLLSGANQEQPLFGLSLPVVVAPPLCGLLDLIVVPPALPETAGGEDVSSQQRPVCPTLRLPSLFFELGDARIEGRPAPLGHSSS